MNNPNPDFSPMARRLAEALNLPDWDDLNDAELEQLLDATEAEGISEIQHDFILTQAQQLIQQWEDSTMAQRSSEYHSPNAGRHTVAASSSPSDIRPGTRTRTNRNGSGSAVIMAGLALLAIAGVWF